MQFVRKLNSVEKSVWIRFKIFSFIKLRIKIENVFGLSFDV